MSAAMPHVCSNFHVGLGLNNAKLCGCILVDIVDQRQYLARFPAAFDAVKSGALPRCVLTHMAAVPRRTSLIRPNIEVQSLIFLPSRACSTPSTMWGCLLTFLRTTLSSRRVPPAHQHCYFSRPPIGSQQSASAPPATAFPKPHPGPWPPAPCTLQCSPAISKI